MQPSVQLYDTTLRDGTQGEGISLSLADKLRIAEKLDHYGFHYIEGGWPGSNEKDIEFFRAARSRSWQHAKIAAFGSTRRAGIPSSEDAQVALLLAAETPVVTIFGKSWLLHVREVLRTTPEENLAMIRETVRHLREAGREVVYDAEHFFDGYKDAPDYAVRCLAAAVEGGASALVLCDTNGGSLPLEVQKITGAVCGRFAGDPVAVGIHSHNDGGLAVANALVAVQSGASHVQGTINGYGERTGNCNLVTLLPNLQLKLKLPVVSEENMARLRDLSLFVDEVANQNPDARAPFVGASSFAHKGGMHVNAVSKLARTFEHIAPELVGNHQRILVGELSGRSNIVMKARELGISLKEGDQVTRDLVQTIKTLEAGGYEFESADGSFGLLVRRALQPREPFFELIEYHVSIRKSVPRAYETAEATVKLRVGGTPSYTVAEGDGPVNALDQALRTALTPFYPEIARVHLADYKVRIIDSANGTDAVTRVLITSMADAQRWTTLGVSGNIIEASWLALVDSLEHYLWR